MAASKPRLSIDTSQLPPSSSTPPQNHDISLSPSQSPLPSPTSSSDDTAAENYDTSSSPSRSSPSSPVSPQNYRTSARRRTRPPPSSASGQNYDTASIQSISPPFSFVSVNDTSSIRSLSLPSSPVSPQNYRTSARRRTRPPPPSSASGQNYGAASPRSISPPFAFVRLYLTSAIRSLSPPSSPTLPQNDHIPSFLSQITHFTISAYLAYSQHEIVSGYNTHILWDICDHPLRGGARLAEYPDHPALLSSVLSETATRPLCMFLDISCDFFVRPWPIQVVADRKDTPEVNTGPTEQGVMPPRVAEEPQKPITVENILLAIYTTLHRRINQEEWDSLSASQKVKVRRKYEQRCTSESGSDDSRQARVRQNGVLRVDCLMGHTIFGGLTMSVERDATAILTLRRSSRY